MLGTEQARLRASIADIDQRQGYRCQRLRQHLQAHRGWLLAFAVAGGFLVGRAIVAAPDRAAAPGAKPGVRGLLVALVKSWLYRRLLSRRSDTPYT